MPEVRIPLGLSLDDGPTLRQLVQRVSMCSSVAAAGQSSLEFLNEESVFDARLRDVDGQLVANWRPPPQPRQFDLIRPRRRGGIDPLLMRAGAEHDELENEMLQEAATSAEALRRTAAVMNTEPAERLAGAFTEIERELGVTSLPARQFIAAKQRSFDLEIGTDQAVTFDAPAVRTRTTTTFPVGLTIAPASPDDLTQFSAMVLDRTPMNGYKATDLPTDIFPVERDCQFRVRGLEPWQQTILAAAGALGLIIEVTACHSVSTANLKSKGGEIQQITNWGELRAAVLRVLLDESSPSLGAAVA